MSLPLGTCLYSGHRTTRLHIQTKVCVAWRPQNALPESTSTEVGSTYKGPHNPDEHIRWLEQKIKNLERELAGANDRYAQLNGIYTKLADQWNAFQATARPDNRNVHRAEAAGELARKLAEVLIGISYDKDVLRPLLQVLIQLQQDGREPKNLLPDGNWGAED